MKPSTFFLLAAVSFFGGCGAESTPGTDRDLDALVAAARADPSTLSVADLVQVAGRAHEEEGLADAGFYFFGAKIRAKYDRAFYPPQGSGGNDPFLAYAAALQGMGAVLNPRLMADPDVFASVHQRLAVYRPAPPPTGQPGYEVSSTPPAADAAAVFETQRKAYVDQMAQLSELLLIPEYHAAVVILQRANGVVSSPRRPDQAEVEQAIATLKRIETQRGKQGVAAAL